MAASVATVRKRPDQGYVVVDVTCDGSYPAGGYPLTANQLGMVNPPDHVNAEVRTVQGLLAQWDVTNSKLKLFVTGAGLSGVLAEAASGNVSSAVIVRLHSVGDVLV